MSTVPAKKRKQSLNVPQEVVVAGHIAWHAGNLNKNEFTPAAHMGTGGTSHAAVTTTANGFMLYEDKVKLNGIETGANKYIHPTGDGNLHIPATGTNNNKKVLMAGNSSGSLSWSFVDWSNLTGKPSTFAPSTHRHDNATTTADGYLSKEDKVRLNNMQNNAINQTSADARYLRLSGGTIEGNLTINGLLNLGDETAYGAKMTFDGVTASSLKIQNNYGYISLTPINQNWAHIYTDRNAFIFNKPVTSLVNVFRSYDNDLTLQRQSVNKLILGASASTFTTEVVATTFKKTGGIEVSYVGHRHDNASGEADGYMSTEHFSKLEAIEAGANRYVHPSTHSLDIITETTTKKVMTSSERTKLAGIETGANKYTHPSTHPISMITETTTQKVMTADERTKLSGIQTNAINQASADGRYLQLTGGVLSGNLTLNHVGDAKLILNADTDNDTAESGEPVLVLTQDGGYIGAEIKLSQGNANANALVFSPFVGYNETSPIANYSVYIHDKKIWHEGNFSKSEFTPATHIGTGGNTHAAATTNANGFMTTQMVEKLNGIAANANNYTHPTTHSLDIITETTTKKIMTLYERTKLSGIEEEANKYIHPATHSIDIITETTAKKVMTSSERTKLSGIETGANKYVHPDTHPATIIIEDATHRWFTDTERTKLTGVATNANNYTHPSTHPATMIVEDVTHRFFTDVERTKLTGIEENANNYTHPDTHSLDVITETTTKKIMTSNERTKLSGIATGANNYTHPASHALSMITETDTLKIMTAAERTKLTGIETGANKYTHPTTHPATIIVEDITHRWFTDTERAKLTAIEAEANNYIHPATHSLDIITETTTKKIMTSDERTKLAGVATNANNYTHPATHPATMIVEDTTRRFFTDTERTKLTGIEANANNYTHPATHSLDMLTETTTKKIMTGDERTKLAGVANNANNYSHPASHALNMITETDTLKIMTATERTKLTGIEAGANKYVHPTTHPATMIVEDETHRWFTDEERDKLTGVEEGANKYIHPATHSLDVITETTTKKIMTADERTKLGGIATNANNYTHPSSHPATMITEDATHRFFTDTERTKLTGIATGANNYTHPATHSLDIITETTAKKIMTSDERTKLAGIAASANNYVHPSTHPATIIVEDATHRWFTDTERAKLTDIQASAINQATADGRYLQLTGGTITGVLTVSSDITVNGLIKSTKITSGNTQVINTAANAIYVGNPKTPLRLESSVNPSFTIGTVTYTAWHTGNFNPDNKSNTGHTHDDRYYTETEMNTMLTSYGDVKSGASNTFTQMNTFSRAGLALKIQPVSAVSANTVLFQVNNHTGNSLMTMGTGTNSTTAKLVVNGDLEVTGTTVQKSTQDIEGDMNVTGNLNVTGNSVLGDSATDQTTVVGDFRLVGNFKPINKYLEVGRFAVFGISDDLNIEVDSLTFEDIISHFATFNSTADTAIPPVGSGATRYYKMQVTYNSTGTDTSVLRIVQHGTTTEVISFALPAVNSDDIRRVWMSAPFETNYIGTTTFQVKKNVSGKIEVAHIEIIGYDYYV